MNSALKRSLNAASILFLATVAAWLLSRNVAIALFGSLSIVLTWFGFSIWSLSFAVLSFRRSAWRSGVLFLALPLAVPFGAVVAALINQPVDSVYFAAMRPWYDERIARLPRDGKRYAEFNWGGMTYASQGVVYDETDEVGRPPGHQSAAWRSRMKHTDLTCGGAGPIGVVTPLGEHYYFTTFGC